MIKSKTEIVVRYKETDQMGIVHHSNYFPWFEIGRADLFALSGMTYFQVEEEGIMLPLVEAHANYGLGARYMDKLAVISYVGELSGAKVKFCYEVYRDGQRLSKGYTVHAFTTKELRAVNLKKANPKIWALLSSLYSPEEAAAAMAAK